MDKQLWVSMPILRNIIINAAKTPAELERICTAGSITPADLDNADLRLGLDQNCALMEAALRISKDPHLGLHIGEITTQVVLGITGYLMESSKDVRTALQNLQQYTRSFTRLYGFRLEEHDKEAIFSCEPIELWNDISSETARQSVDIAFAGALHITRLLTGRQLQPVAVHYRYPQVRDTAEHERLLGRRPLFSQAGNRMIFTTEDMNLPVIGYNKQLNAVFRTLLEDKLKEQQDHRFASKVRQTILEHYNFTFPQLEEIAAYMHLSPRSLQRKLQDEDTSFRALSDIIKKELACNLLINKTITIAEIAYKLGYTEPAAFQRAFRQWTDKTPGDYRMEGTGN